MKNLTKQNKRKANGLTIYSLLGQCVWDNNGQLRGTVIAVLAQGEFATHLRCADQTEREFYLPLEKVTKTEEGIIATQTCPPPHHTTCVRLGLGIFDDRGGYMGKLTDILLHGTRLAWAVTGRKKIPYRDLQIGDIALLHGRGYIEQKLRSL